MIDSKAQPTHSELRGIPAPHRKEIGFAASNELICASPELLSFDKALTYLSVPPKARDIGFRQASLEVRSEALFSMPTLYVGMSTLAKLFVRLLQTYRSGYAWRAFSNPQVWNHIQRLSLWRHSPHLLPRTAPSGGGAFNVTLTGVSGSGKTSFIDRLTSYFDEETHGEPLIHTCVQGKPARIPQIPYLRIPCMPKATVKGLCLVLISQIDARLGTNHSSHLGRLNETELLYIAQALCSSYFVGILIVDDVQFLKGLSSNAEPVLNAFSTLSEVTGIPLLLCGTYKVKRLYSDFPGASAKLASSGDITLAPLQAKSMDWQMLTTALWQSEVLRRSHDMPTAFAARLHSHTLGVPRITREAMQEFHRLTAEMEDEGTLDALIASGDSWYAGLLDKIAEVALLRYQRVLATLRLSGEGALTPQLAQEYEDYFPPQDDLRALARARAGRVTSSEVEAGEKMSPMSTIERPARRARLSSQQKVSKEETLRLREIADSSDTYARLKQQGWMGLPLLDVR